MIQRISPAGGATPAGPYSPVVRCGDFLYVSGQGPVDPATNKVIEGDISSETRRTLENIRILLEGAGASPADVVKVNVYLANAKDFAAMNAVYAEFFGDAKPARTTIACGFAAPIQVEIDCVAYRPQSS